MSRPASPPPGRRSTPRPDFGSATVIRRVDVAHHVWGDTEAGFVTDRVIVSTANLHVLEFELPPGGEFRHSALNPTVFAGDVLYFVLAGELVLADPSTGEVALVPAGTGRLFHRDTWHNGFNPGRTTVRVLEFFSPPPARGTSSDYARSQPALETSVFADQRWRGRWPEARAEQQATAAFLVADPAAGLLRFRDAQASHLLSILVDTPYLRVAQGSVAAGHVEDFAAVETESLVVVTSGELWVDVWNEPDGYRATSVLQPGDAMYLPVGASERMLVRAAEPATYLRGWGEVPEGWTP
ncbi:MAG: hypothetical protein VB093_03455 [Propionicimonas sp.]|nr:hypothetical protein [Propionicimonas sp.]